MELSLYDGDLRPEFREKDSLEPLVHFRDTKYKHFSDAAQAAMRAAGRAVYYTTLGSFESYNAVYPPTLTQGERHETEQQEEAEVRPG